MKKLNWLSQDYVICIIPLWIGNNEISPINLSLTVVFVVLIKTDLIKLYSSLKVLRNFQVMCVLNNNRFIVVKRFYNEFGNNNIDVEFLDLSLTLSLPDIEKNTVYGFKGFFNDFVILNLVSNKLKDKFDKGSMSLYIQFKNFFLIKTLENEVYFFDNFVFEKDIDHLEISLLAKEALKCKKFRDYHKSLDKYNLAIKNPYYRYIQNNDSVCFYFNDIKFSEQLVDWVIKRYKFYFYSADDKFIKKYILDILIFEDIILINSYEENKMYIYKNIFSIEVIKNKFLFSIKFKEYLYNEYKYNKIYTI